MSSYLKENERMKWKQVMLKMRTKAFIYLEKALDSASQKTSERKFLNDEISTQNCCI